MKMTVEISIEYEEWSSLMNHMSPLGYIEELRQRLFYTMGGRGTGSLYLS